MLKKKEKKKKKKKKPNTLNNVKTNLKVPGKKEIKIDPKRN